MVMNAIRAAFFMVLVGCTTRVSVGPAPAETQAPADAAPPIGSTADAAPPAIEAGNDATAEAQGPTCKHAPVRCVLADGRPFDGCDCNLHRDYQQITWLGTQTCGKDGTPRNFGPDPPEPCELGATCFVDGSEGSCQVVQL